MTNRGTVRWMVLEKAINAELLIEFLWRLAKDAERKVFLILDNLKKKATVSELRRLVKSPDLVRKFFQHEPVRYDAA